MALKNKLDDEFSIIFEEKNPDYLIYNVFSDEDQKPEYQNAIKIAVYTENIIPDINSADYIIGHYHINYLDRFFKYSIFLWNKFSDIDKNRELTLKKPIRNKFFASSNFKL